MPGGRERNILRWELREAILREHIARIDERLARLSDGNASSPSVSSSGHSRRDELLAKRAELARELDGIGHDPRAKMG
jgi:hypothetical protein